MLSEKYINPNEDNFDEELLMDMFKEFLVDEFFKKNFTKEEFKEYLMEKFLMEEFVECHTKFDKNSKEEELKEVLIEFLLMEEYLKNSEDPKTSVQTWNNYTKPLMDNLRKKEFYDRITDETAI